MHDFQVLSIIVEVVAKKNGLSATAVRQLYSDNRSPALVKLRDTILCLIRRKTSLSLPEIGSRFKKHHSSILVSIRREEERLKRNIPWRGGTWQEYHVALLAAIDAAIAEAKAAALVN